MRLASRVPPSSTRLSIARRDKTTTPRTGFAPQEMCKSPNHATPQNGNIAPAAPASTLHQSKMEGPQFETSKSKSALPQMTYNVRIFVS
ncbi:hypothetical protein CBOM_06256 [Ceraceosorus bombacis]|uniref:Uncharacterized protein n=1 Tax=Ceraceosorus bombacis TaxID=401625 RepID=A0A0P1BJ51_9BASI|nr:hypothetical protein CBOM_06256 [Ceraceosorus bombacis]